MKHVYWIIAFLCLYSCQGDNNSQIEGFFKTVQGNFSIPTNPPPVLTIVGRANEVVDMQLTSAQIDGSQVGFEINELPAGQTVVFSVAGPQIQSMVTFPINPNQNKLFSIPILAPGTLEAFRNSAMTLLGNTSQVNPSQGIVGGLLRENVVENGQVGVSGGQEAGVRLINRTTGTIATTQQGPFYFDNNGGLVQNAGCVDALCSFLFVNLSEGSYTLETISSVGQTIAQIEVLVFASQLTFGIRQ